MRVTSPGDTLLLDVLNGNSVVIFANPNSATLGEEVLATSLALQVLLTNKGKQVDVVYPASFSEQMHFLPRATAVQSSLPTRDLILRFSLNKDKIEKMHYYVEDGTCSIVISPEGNSLTPSDLTYAYQPFQYDGMILLGYSSVEELGDVYSQNALDFSTSPIVNIDVSPHNTHFGLLNVVDTNALGVSEIVFANLGSWGLRPDYAAAECLLFGLGLLNNYRQDGITETDNTIVPTMVGEVSQEMIPEPSIHSSGGTTAA